MYELFRNSQKITVWRLKVDLFIILGWDYVSEQLPPTTYCSSPGWMWAWKAMVMTDDDDDAGWG
jgi:hypothetical protein